MPQVEDHKSSLAAFPIMKGVSNMATNDDFLDRPESRNSGEMLDHSPLKFGRYKGKTPAVVAEKEPKGESWLRWAYETVGNFDVCSEALYKDCGGKGKRAVRDDGPGYQGAKPYSGQRAAEDQARQQQRVEDARKSGFDNMDDDIPF